MSVSKKTKNLFTPFEEVYQIAQWLFSFSIETIAILKENRTALVASTRRDSILFLKINSVRSYLCNNFCVAIELLACYIILIQLSQNQLR